MQQELFMVETESERKFREFHQANPKVYVALVRLARQAKARGKSKLSIELLVNVVRWEIYLATEDPNSEFKINNNYKSFYSRLIMKQEPDLAEIFNTREHGSFF